MTILEACGRRVNETNSNGLTLQGLAERMLQAQILDRSFVILLYMCGMLCQGTGRRDGIPRINGRLGHPGTGGTSYHHG